MEENKDINSLIGFTLMGAVMLLWLWTQPPIEENITNDVIESQDFEEDDLKLYNIYFYCKVAFWLFPLYVATNTWFGNTKYGILVNGGSGFHLDGCFVEACDTGVMIASNFADHDIVGMQEPGAITNCRFDRLFVYNCGKANQLGYAGLYVTGIHAEYNISSTSGTFTVGETVTGGTSGETMTVVSASSSEIIANDASGAFTVGETLTGGTSGATATFDSSNDNDVRDLQFSQLEARQCDRYGAHFEHCSGITVQGHFFGNGANASSISAGAKGDDNVENIIFHGCTFADTVSSGSTS